MEVEQAFKPSDWKSFSDKKWSWDENFETLETREFLEGKQSKIIVTLARNRANNNLFVSIGKKVMKMTYNVGTGKPDVEEIVKKSVSLRKENLSELIKILTSLNIENHTI